MPDFVQVLEAAVETSTGRAFTVPETWHQGRTAYGGFSSAIALEEAFRIGERDGATLPSMRSAQIAMIAPLSGQIEASAQVLRRGRNATWIETRISGEQGPGLVANFVFMQAVESRLGLDRVQPPDGLIVPEDAVPLSRDRGATFLRANFETRHALPREAQDPAQKCWWIRPDRSEGLHPMTSMLLCADALPPGVMSLLGPTVPVSTMHWQVNVLDHDPRPFNGWWLLRSCGDYARDGAASQNMAMWGAGKRAVSAGTQSIALFG